MIQAVRKENKNQLVSTRSPEWCGSSRLDDQKQVACRYQHNQLCLHLDSTQTQETGLVTIERGTSQVLKIKQIQIPNTETNWVILIDKLNAHR